jgi:hypothetical protein
MGLAEAGVGVDRDRPAFLGQNLLLHGELVAAEPKKLRYRLLHVAARITRSGRRTWVRIAECWPWATDLVTAFTRLAALPRSQT